MNRYLAALALMGALAVPASAHASSTIPADDPHGCKLGSKGYIHSGGKCYHVASAGKSFTVATPSMKTQLTGVGTAATAGHEIAVTRVAAVLATPKSEWLRVQANGSFPPLRARHARIYGYNPKTGKLTRVNAIKTPGVYALAPTG